MALVRKATTRRDVGGYDDPIQAWSHIAQLREAADASGKKRKYHELINHSAVSIVPYLGIQSPGSRPGKAIKIVGCQDVYELAAMWRRMLPKELLLVHGPKGSGKSCRLRAFASLLCAAAKDAVVVCIWNMERARRDLVTWLVDGLVFAYSARNDDELLKRIRLLQTEAEIKDFMKERTAAGDDFTIVVDGAQVLDTVTNAGTLKVGHKQISQAFLTLMDIVADYKVVFGLSPRAMQMQEIERKTDDTVKLFSVKGFNEDQLQTFMMKASVLGAVVGDNWYRKQQVEYYAGDHPLSLDILDRTCVEVAGRKLGSGGDSTDLEVDVETGYWASVVTPPDLTPEQVAEILEDDWEAVISAYIGNQEFSAIRISIRNLRITGDFSTVSQIIEADPRYAYKSELRFCSPFIQQIYVEEFRNKEADDDLCGPWVKYAQIVIRSPALNWCEAGWMCERLCNDVISRRGMRIDTGGFFFDKLSSETFSTIPRRVKVEMLSRGNGFMFIPIQYNYGKVDAIVFFRTTDGKLHILGIQYTTSLDKHLHSEAEFMSVRVLQNWYPNIVEASREGKVILDYVFVCTDSREWAPKPENTRLLHNGSVVGILKHNLHVIKFEEALEGRVPSDVWSLMRNIAKERDNCFQHVPGAQEPILPPVHGTSIELSKSQFQRIRRFELDALALNAGIDPNPYCRMEDLKQKLVKEKVIVVVPK